MRTLIFSVGALFAISCGGGSSGSGFNAGVAGNKRLNQLTPAEFQTFCTNLTAAFLTPAFIDVQCHFLGIDSALLESQGAGTDAQLQADCTAAYATCQAAEKDAGANVAAAVDGGLGASSCTQPAATCTATVDQLSACLEEMLPALQVDTAPACSTLTRATLAMLVNTAPDAGTPTYGPACKAYLAACPDAPTGPMTSALKLMSR